MQWHSDAKNAKGHGVCPSLILLGMRQPAEPTWRLGVTVTFSDRALTLSSPAPAHSPFPAAEQHCSKSRLTTSQELVITPHHLASPPPSRPPLLRYQPHLRSPSAPGGEPGSPVATRRPLPPTRPTFLRREPGGCGAQQAGAGLPRRPLRT